MVTRHELRHRARRHLDRQTAAIAAVAGPRPAKGWVHAVRNALGLTTRQLAARMGRAPSTIVALEKGEVAETVSLRTLREAAENLGCTLTYAFVPNEPLERTVRRRARAKAEARMRIVGHGMVLEAQAVPQDVLASEIEQLTDRLVRTEGSRLWHDP